MKRSSLFLTLGKMPLDAVAAFVAWIFAWKIRPVTDLIPFLHSYFPPQFVPEWDFIFPVALFSALGFVLISAIFGLYSFEKKSETMRLLASTIFWGMAIISFFVLVRREVIFSRMMLGQAMIFTFLFAGFFRILWGKMGKILRRETRKIALFGTPAFIAEVQKILRDFPEFCVEVTSDRLSEISRKKIQEIWLVAPNIAPETERDVRDFAARNHLDIRLRAAEIRDFARIETDFFGGIPFLRPRAANLSGWGSITKRLFDLTCAILLFIFLSPVFAILAIGVKLSSPGKILHISRRVGKNGKSFPLFKFRSMVEGAEKMKKKLQEQNHRADGPFFKIKNDPRVTPFGSFLRRFSLDELPQILNVLRGEMSLIGPRPHFPEEIKKCPPEFSKVLSVPPGISGLAQVSGRSDLPFEDEMRLDLYYIFHWSFWLDVVIFFRTIAVIVRGKGAD